MDVSTRRVSSTHVSRERLSRKSEIPSTGEVEGCGFATTCVSATGFVFVVADFLCLLPAALGAVVVLGSAFSGYAAFLVAVTCGCLGVSVTGCGMGLGALTLIIRPLGRRGSIPRPGPSAQQKVLSGSISRQQQVCLLRPSCGPVEATALQARDSPLSNSHIHGSSPCDFLQSCSTEVFPAGPSSHQSGESSTRDAPRSVLAVPLRMAEALATLSLKWAFRRHVRLHRDPQTAELSERAHSGQLRTSCHRHNEVGVGGRSLTGSWSRRPGRSCMTPWTRMFMDSSSYWTTLSGIPLHRFFTDSRIKRSSGSEKA